MASRSPPVHDLSGQTTGDGRVYEHQDDAFGRMVGVYLRDSGSGFGGTAIAAYRYDGLGQRVAQRGNSQGITSADPWFHFAHDDRWRVIGTHRGNAGHIARDTNAKERFVWHAAGRDGTGSGSYIDPMAWLHRNLSNAWRDNAAQPRRPRINQPMIRVGSLRLANLHPARASRRTAIRYPIASGYARLFRGPS